jgi:hypothetical protein
MGFRKIDSASSHSDATATAVEDATTRFAAVVAAR